ncbi:MAG: hypothetical protein ACXV8L_03135 [Ilumatobacteraceae bacterium]
MSAMMDPLLERQPKRVTRTRSGSSNLQTDVRDRATIARQRSARAAKGHDAAAELDPESPQPRRRPRRVLIGRIVLGIAVLAVPMLYSYTIALTGPGSDSLQARSVEWARDNHLGPVVDRFEKWYYSHHQAAVGGTPSANVLPAVAVAPTPASSTGVSAPTGSAAPTGTAAPTDTAAPGGTPVQPTVVVATPQADSSGAPAPLQTPAAVPVAGEGKWSALGPLVNGHAGAYVAAIRPDNVYTSSMDAVVNFDPKYFSFRAYPGTKIPKPWDRPDYVEPERQHLLVAAFSGGFRLRDSGGGMILGGAQILPMKNGIATMSIDKNGVPNVGMWGRDITSASGLDSARQNLTLIVDNGVPNPDLLTDANRKWGFTGPKNKSAVWRSGAGITADGHLVWVGGPGLTIESLAGTLIRAGAVRGMQLEINQEWVQLNTYSTNSAGMTNGKRLLPGMQHTGNRWLTEDTRDFVAAFVRSS